MRRLPLLEFGYALGVVLIASLTYLLSGGPVVYFEAKGSLPGDPELWALLYAPARWIYENVECYHAYIDWWQLIGRGR
jgi:hypothetical protein